MAQLPAVDGPAPMANRTGDSQTSAYPVKPTRTVLDDRFYTYVIMVKFADGLLIRLRGSELTDLGTGALGDAPTQAALALVAGGTWERVHSLPEDELDGLRATAQQNLGRPVADLNLYYHLYLPPGVDANATIDIFNALDVVEMAQGVPIAVPPPTPPDFEPEQGYLNGAPTGIGARPVWAYPGGTGAGVRLADLEYSWNLQHADFPAITLLGPQPFDPSEHIDHGTAVLGEIFGLANGWGVTGAAYDATGYVVATRPFPGILNIAGAITTALGTLRAGDVILIEQQLFGPNTPTCCWFNSCTPGTNCAYVPVEWDRGIYVAIVTAVGNGVIVVEAAGNGQQDLDDPIYATGNGGHWPFLPENDSGALIVGAGAAPAEFGGSDVDRSRLFFSNYGSTVDLQGWGEAVYTAGYGDAYSAEGENYYFTGTFNGTSSASPNVAAAAALVQSMYKSATGVTLPPVQVKNLLRERGSPQQTGVFPADQNIGPRPDVVRVQPARIVAWGSNNYGQCNVPVPKRGFVAVAADYWHSLGLKADGSVVAWGWNYYGQCNVPPPNTGFVAVSAGGYHSLGLKADGSVVAWGWNYYGQCNVPPPNTGFVAVAAGGGHSLGLKADGSVVAWGFNESGQCNVPAPNTGFVAVAAGSGHSLGLKADASIESWGRNEYGQCNVPPPNADFVAVAGGYDHSLGLKTNGSIVAWGRNEYGQCNVPPPNADFVALAAGGRHSLGLKALGSIVAWGRNDSGQCNVPAPKTGFIAVAAGHEHSLGLRSPTLKTAVAVPIP